MLTIDELMIKELSLHGIYISFTNAFILYSFSDIPCPACFANECQLLSQICLCSKFMKQHSDSCRLSMAMAEFQLYLHCQQPWASGIACQWSYVIDCHGESYAGPVSFTHAPKFRVLHCCLQPQALPCPCFCCT